MEAPAPSPELPTKCGRTCNSNLECAGDILGSCSFCNFGKCKDTSPAAPVPMDAIAD